MKFTNELLLALFGSTDVSEIRSTKETERANKEPVVRAATLDSRNITIDKAECQALCKKIKYVYQEGDEYRVFQMTMTDETVDRYGDIVVAKGGNFKNYYPANPVILSFHKSGEFPIGQCLKLTYDKAANAVIGWVLIFSNEVDNTGISETFFRMLKAGALKAGSIGFMPTKYYWPDEAERSAKGMPEYGYIFSEWEMLEFSICSVPANPNALNNSVAKGIISREQAKSLCNALREKQIPLGAWEKTFELLSSSENAEIKEVTEDSELPVEEIVNNAIITISMSELKTLINDAVIKALPKVENIAQGELIIGKAGAVISKKNRSLLTDAVTKLNTAKTAIDEAVSAVQELLDSTSSEEEDDEEEEPEEGADNKSAPEVKSIFDADFMDKLKQL